MAAQGFTVWDYSGVDGTGCAVINRPERCQHAFGPSTEALTLVTRVTAHSVKAAEASYRSKWAGDVDFRHCACGCLRDAVGQPEYRDGQRVDYRGSLTELHGLAYYCGPCWCGSRDSVTPDCGGFELENGLGQVIRHARYESFSATGESQ